MKATVEREVVVEHQGRNVVIHTGSASGPFIIRKGETATINLKTDVSHS